MDDSRKKRLQDRSKINMHEPHQVQYWTKHLKVSNQELERAVEKVGNAAAAVRKELAQAKASYPANSERCCVMWQTPG